MWLEDMVSGVAEETRRAIQGLKKMLGFIVDAVEGGGQEGTWGMRLSKGDDDMGGAGVTLELWEIEGS